MSQFDRFRTEKIQTGREFFNERNCLQHNAKPENLACHRFSLVSLFIQSNKDLWLAFCAVYIVHTGPEGQMMHFCQNTLTKYIEAKYHLFCNGIINHLFDGITYNTDGHFAHCSYFSSPLGSSVKYYATRKISLRIIC